jgi:hypothetical protein
MMFSKHLDDELEFVKFFGKKFKMAEKYLSRLWKLVFGLKHLKSSKIVLPSFVRPGTFQVKPPKGGTMGLRISSKFFPRILLLIWSKGSFYQTKLENQNSNFYSLLNFLGLEFVHVLKNLKIFAFVCCNFSVCNKTTVKHGFIQ